MIEIPKKNMDTTPSIHSLLIFFFKNTFMRSFVSAIHYSSKRRSESDFKKINKNIDDDNEI